MSSTFRVRVTGETQGTGVEIHGRVRDLKTSRRFQWVTSGGVLTYHLVDSAPLAQTAERLHGKEKVHGSIP